MPTLTALTLPDVDVTGGVTSGIFSAGATDVGAGVDRVWISLDRRFNTGSGLRDFVFLYDSTDSFADGYSSISQMFGSASAAGTYNIQTVGVTDKAGNNQFYPKSELASLGFDTSFDVSDRNLTPTAYVTAPASVVEGTDGSIALELVLRNVAIANTNVTVYFASESTATNGSDVSMSNFSGSYSITQSPAGNYTITLPSIAVLDDLMVEGAETLAIRITASGQIFDTGNDSTIVRIALVDNDIAGRASSETLNGTALKDSLYGFAGDDLLQGLGGADLLDGGTGNDTLDGGTGLDTLIGGEGNDVFFVDAAGDSVVEAAGEGDDRVLAGASYRLGAGASVEMLTTRDAAGTAAIDFVGNEFANTLAGNAGASILNGGGGADVLVALAGDDVLIGGDGAANTMQGGLGNDTYYVSATGDSVIEFAGEGNDTVRTALGVYALGGNVENLVYVGAGSFVGIGDAVGNVILGGAGNDILNGQDGADILVGGAGADVLIGGSGANTLQGGSGNDLYYVSSVGDTIVEALGAGYDTISTSLAA